MRKPLVQSLDRETLPYKIAETLRRSFVNGNLASGTRLVETEIAEQLGVSRNPLREAIRILQSEGLVEVHHNRGTYVAHISEEDIEEIYSLRSLLEVYAVSRVAERATVEQIDQLQAMVNAMEQATAGRDYRRAADIDLQLHKTIWEFSGHRRLLQILSSMQAQIRMFLTVNTQLYEDLVTIAVSDHQQIVDAIRLRDGAEAARLMKHHIEFAVQQTRAFFQRKRVVEAEQVQLAVETSSRGRDAT